MTTTIKSIYYLAFVLIIIQSCQTEEIPLFCSCLSGTEACCEEGEQWYSSKIIPAVLNCVLEAFPGEGIGAAVNLDTTNSNIFLFNLSGNQYTVSVGGQIQATYQLDASNGPLAGCPLGAISGAHLIEGELFLFDTSGLYFAAQSPDGSWTEKLDLYYWSKNGSHPFLKGTAGQGGIGAALSYTKHGNIHFSLDGKFLSHYVPKNRNIGNFNLPIPLAEWEQYLEAPSPIPFIEDGVGAAFQVQMNDDLFTQGNGQIKLGIVLFDHSGLNFSIFHPDHGWSQIINR